MKIIRNTVLTLALIATAGVGSVGLSVVGSSTPLRAADSPAGTPGGCSGGSVIFPRWYDNGLCQDGKIISPKQAGTLGSDKTGIAAFVTKLALNIVAILLYVVGYVSLAFIIYGGFKYMISGDNASGTSAAKKTILNAIIGLVLSIMSVAIVKLISESIRQ